MDLDLFPNIVSDRITELTECPVDLIGDDISPKPVRVVNPLVVGIWPESISCEGEVDLTIQKGWFSGVIDAAVDVYHHTDYSATAAGCRLDCPVSGDLWGRAKLPRVSRSQ